MAAPSKDNKTVAIPSDTGANLLRAKLATSAKPTSFSLERCGRWNPESGYDRRKAR
ncbi:hypothetical protein GCM10009097_17660 [Pigmentiphaga daeguensis]|uniref:Uncharacterized protein n=1 Tax=Pigmentiphaga daeguensis TaxID=414049 RepID=A0ABP3LNP9_9BURK